MTEQTEKVCKGLEELRNFADTDVHPAVSPDNWDVYSDLCDLIDKLTSDTLALIQQQPEQAAHVMTLKEIENMTPDPDTGDNFCWIEYRDGATRLIHVNLVDSLCPVAEYPNGHKSLVYQCSGSSGHANYLHDQVYYIRTWYVHHGDFDTYNLTWRCWTQRPSDAERSNTPWSD